MDATLLRLKVGNYKFPIRSETGAALVFGQDGNLAPALVAITVSGAGISDRVAKWDTSSQIISSVLSVNNSGDVTGIADLTASGTVNLTGLVYPTSDGTIGQAMITDGSGALTFDTVGNISGVGVSGRVVVWDGPNSVSNNFITVDDSGNMGGIADLTASGTVNLTGLVYPVSDGVDGQALFTDGSGFLDFRSVSVSGESNTYGSFGALITTNLIAAVQIDATSGIRSVIHEIFTDTGGSVTMKSDHGGREFECATGTSIGGFGLLRSIVAVRYHPGQGVTMMWTARFSPPVALLAQRAGGIAVGCELSFGHDGTNGFGVLYRTAGRLEIRLLTLTGAAGGSETATVTLNSVAITVDLTSGTEAHNAFQIASDPDFLTNGWSAFQNESTVIFIARAVGPMAGSYSFSSATATGTITQVNAGTVVVDTWVYQASWDNPTPFGVEALNPLNGNVYRADFGYLGYALIKYSVMDPDTGEFILVHTIKYPNRNQVPNIDSPSFKIGWFAASLGSTTDASVFGASAVGQTEGKQAPNTEVGFSTFNTKNVGVTLTNVLSIRSRAEINSFINFSELVLHVLSIAVDGTKPAVLEVWINAALGGEPNWQYINQTNSNAEFDTAGTTVSGGVLILTLVVGKTGNELINVADFTQLISREETITVAVQATSGTTDASVSLSWTET